MLAIELYQSGLSISKVCRQLNTSYSSTRKLLLRQGVIMRKGAGAGLNNPNWKGGIRHYRGYIECLKPKHPRANKEGYVLRAILVWEEANGRPFPEGMEPHHKNEVRDDDRPYNIEPKFHSKHMREHAIMKKRDVMGRFAKGEAYAV